MQWTVFESVSSTNQINHITVHILRVGEGTEINRLRPCLIPAQGSVVLETITGAVLMSWEVRHKLSGVF